MASDALCNIKGYGRNIRRSLLYQADLLAIDARIPDDIKTKYSSLYADNDSFNKKLVQLARADGLTLAIGQDDAQPFGLPNRNANRMRWHI